MATKIHSRRRTWLNVLAPILVLSPLASHSAPGTLPDIPLFLSASAEPNILFLLDNSGSMSNIVPDTPYDAATPYFTCPSDKEITVNSDQYIDVRITSGGSPSFRRSGSTTDYDWGTSGDVQCFDPSKSYFARLYGNGGSNGSTKYPSGYLWAKYTGNYLNWYFGSSPTSWGADARKKPGTNRRMEIAQEAAKSLVTSLNNVRAGLVSYNSSDGAEINEGLAALDSAKKTAMTSAIDALTPSGMTPLAESLHDIGRYLVGESSPQYEGNLVLHPGQANETTVDDDTVFDHSPAYASGVSDASPIQYFCQQNFAILLTDGRPQGDQDIAAATGLQDYDGDCDGATPACGSYDQKDSTLDYGYESQGSDYLDDVAKALYEMDLRPDLDDLDGNEVKNNLITYTIGFADDQVINDPLMEDTAKNGGGEFLTAANSSELVDAFKEATESIFGQIGSASAVAFNSSTLGTNSDVYLALFESINWSGDLVSYGLDPITGDINSTPSWRAANVLDNRDLSTSARTILTYGASDGIALQWDNLTTAQKADLCTDTACAADPDTTTSADLAIAKARLDFLRGDRSNEGTGQNFRTRNSRLGDIVHAGPVYIGKPELNWPDAAPFPTTTGYKYSDFKAAHASRSGVVYIGANDGMLHGFRESDGHEVLAYIPSNLFSTTADGGLHYLTDADYQHQNFVDLISTVSDVYIKTSTSDLTRSWRTVLLGGERGGGRGYFALDVTDPSTFSESGSYPADIVLWEFTNADLGYTFSRPSIVLMNNGEWAAIFGNGYNDAGSGEAQLFIVFLEGGLDGTWTLDTDYIKISTDIGDTADRNGLATPAVVDLDGDGDADRAYAGDLKGNLWAFDLSDSNASRWDVAYKQGNIVKPLFTASGPNNELQPISGVPMVVRNPDMPIGGNEPNLLVLFGTGQYLVDADKSNTDPQSFYGVWDSGTKELVRSNLVKQDFEPGFPSNVRVTTNKDVAYNVDKYGWYLELTDSGERAVTDPVVRGDIVYFDTTIPSSQPCSYGGTGWLMSVNYVNGGRPDSAVFDYNDDGAVDDQDLLDQAVGHDDLHDVAPGGEKFSQGLPTSPNFLGNKQYIPGTQTTNADSINVRDVEDLGGQNTGRLSWEELAW